MDKEAVVHIYNGILLSRKKECIWTSSNEVDEPRAYYTEWSKSEREIYILYAAAAAAATKLLQLCPTLCDPVDGSQPGSPIPGILQARILEWIAIPFFRGSSWSRDQTQISCIAGKFFTIWATREAPSIPYICINIRYLSVFYLLHSV